MAKADEPLTTPFRVVIDSKEKLPFAFVGLQADADNHYRPLVVPTIRRGLPAGDYSIDTLETVDGADAWVSWHDSVAVERKSAVDLYGTIAQGRERFDRELAYLDGLSKFAAVVVEAEMSDLLSEDSGPIGVYRGRSELPRKNLWRSILAWQVRYRRVAWWFCDGRRAAEVTTFRLLEKVWKAAQKTSTGERL